MFRSSGPTKLAEWRGGGGGGVGGGGVVCASGSRWFRAARGFVPVASGWVPAGRAVCIQLPCGTRIEVGADDLDAVRTVVAEVARAYRGCEVARAEHGPEAGVA